MGGTAGAKVEVLVQRALTNGLPARQSSAASGAQLVLCVRPEAYSPLHSYSAETVLSFDI